MSTVADLPASAEILNGQNGKFDYAVDDGGQRHRITWKVSWEDSPAFLRAVKGYTQQIGGINRTIPLQDPYISNLYAVAIQGRGMGADSAISASRPYVKMHYTVEFATLPYGTDGDSAYISLNHTGSSRSVTVPGRQYQFADGTKIQQDIAIPVGGVGISLTVHQIPSLAAFMNVAGPLVGKVNSTTLSVAGITYAAGTVYFETFDTQTNKSVLGVEQTEASISLVYSALEWNKAIKPDGTASDISPPPFAVADLNGLVI